MGRPNNQPGSNGSFLPRDYVVNKSQMRANFFALLLFTLVMAGVIGAFVVNHQRWRAVRDEADAISAQFAEEASKIDQLKALEAQRADLLDRAEVVTALVDRVPRSVLMAEIVRDMPSGVVLTLVSLDGERSKPPPPPTDPKAKGKSPKTRSLTSKSVAPAEKEAAPEKVHPPRFKHRVAVEGLAPDNESIADYLAAIESSPLFTEVELPLIQSTIVNDVGYRRFKFTMTLRDQANARQVAGVQEVAIQGDSFATVNTDDAAQAE